MEPGVVFGGSNTGLQIAKNYAPVNFGSQDKVSGLLEKIPMIESAAFNSYEDQHEDTCLSGTRADILNRINDWASSPKERCIFWLCGMAGTGKSTISRTVATSFHEAKKLGASFFFKRGEEDRGRALKLFSTIARQLAINIPGLASHIAQAAENDPVIATKAMKEQFDKLLLQPLKMVSPPEASTKNTVAIVIDALDECDGDNDINLMLKLLPELQKLSSLRIRVFLTSRPELAIRLGFSKLAVQDHEDLILHDIPKQVIRHDISLFLNHRLSEIKMMDQNIDLPPEWPGETHFESLVTLSVPLFIFAATVCRIFEDIYFDPIESLAEILAQGGNISTIGAESNMDRVYLPVLNRLLRAQGQNEKQKERLVQEFQQIIGSIVLLESPLSISALSNLLGLPQRLLQMRLNLLHSVLLVPGDSKLPIRTFHLSFRDFLLDGETKEKTVFWVDGKLMHQNLASRCLLSCRKLQRNICGLPDEAFQRIEVDRQTIDRCIPPELQYACRYWIYHVGQCERPTDLMAEALSFLQSHFLHWVEVMGILDQISEALRMLNILQEIATHENCSDMSAFLQDARRFIFKNRQIADKVPLQIYSAGLIFCPQQSIVRRTFAKESPGWISQLPRTEKSWSAELQVLEGHSESVNSVAFSPDGRVLASASRDTTVQLWDVATGALKQTLEDDANAEWMESLSFSPDGQLLAAGSTSSTSRIRLWNTATGVCQATFTSGIGSVKSVTFSPSGDILVSAGADYSVEIWDVKSLQPLRIFDTGHSDWVRSVAFLPNGQLVSASRDKTVRISDIATGKNLREFTGHVRSVNTVAVSPDGLLMASGSEDGLIKVWDLATGLLKWSLEGQCGALNSMTFSPNGQMLASGSWDDNLRLWDIKTGSCTQIIRHPDEVNSVTFSPDGLSLATACQDKTVRIWETRMDPPQNLESHSDVVSTVTLSPDARLLASGSEDKTVRIWDADTGTLYKVLQGHERAVRSVVFSPDGQLLATRGRDERVVLWNVSTGEQLRKMLDCESSITFSPDSKLLAFAATDYSVRICDVTALDSPLQALDPHYKTVTMIAFSPDGRLLASTSHDEMVRLWNIPDWTLKEVLDGHTDWVRSVAFSPDSKALATASDDCTIRLWNVNGVLQRTFQFTDTVFSVRFGQEDSQLTTNLGTLDMDSNAQNDAQKLSKTIKAISIDDEHWVQLHGKRALWLPSEARPVSFSVNGNILGMGHRSGQISVIGFHV